MNIFNINDIPKFSKKDRIVVVGIIGKSPYRYPNKTTPLLSAVQSDENGIECHWDERKGILYLHTVTYLDTKRLAELAENLDVNSKSTKKEADAAHWLVASGELAVDSCRIISLLFQLCHIVVLTSPTSTFDLGYLQLFKAIDGYRTELATQITAALTEIGAEGSWEKHGRTSCPRLLFHFRRAPAKSLFAIPKNEEFVYMSTDTSSNARDVSTLVRGLVAMCAGAEPEVATDRPSFLAFLQSHIDRAFNEGFDDNALAPVFLEARERGEAGEEGELGGALAHALATDVRFSAARCSLLRKRRTQRVYRLITPVNTMQLSDGSKEHSSGVRYVSACNCGRTRVQREDPYTVRAANCTFYTHASEQCGVCSTLQQHDFPVFEPSTPSFRSLHRASRQLHLLYTRTRASSAACVLHFSSTTSPCSSPLLPALDKVMTRQPSTTEYLPGMLHADSPPGLLPAFPSWSLVCLGASSLYSHSLGLPEPLQPGLFMMSSPDTVVSGGGSAGVGSGAKVAASDMPLYTACVCLGGAALTAQLSRIHVVTPKAPVHVTLDPKVAASDMPLYTACVCLGGAALTAQLSRIHVVTPKAPVHVTLDPKVQPVAGGSIFVPQPTGSSPVKLTASTYWVLRLPHVYSDERGTLPRPRTPPSHPGSILAPLFGLQE
ncbi:Protein smg8 [Operophtera brumata]|uniref:Nonsense-mediated mRNA decay factor SMG8 n=1 Tax=Operophtera brumata TaxID=104452 RepID=A0A0L7LGR9_OPEBR|nr:Protein smg8 [Operophtera brumata]